MDGATREPLVPEAEVRRDMAAILQCVGNRDGAGFKFIVESSADPGWLVGLMADMLLERIERDGDREQVLADLLGDAA